MSIYQPYFYIIGWSQLDRWYVGRRTAKKCHPSDLMVTYFTSSKNYVHPFIEQHGLPDVVWTFPCKTAKEAQANEIRIMREFHNFLPDPRWLNRAIGGLIIFDDEARKRISKAHKGKIVSQSTRAKISAANKGHSAWNKGIKMSPETCAAMSQGQKGKKMSPKSAETKAKISASNKGKKKPMSDEHRQKISAAIKAHRKAMKVST
ncbi:NUMOD3 domain-containing DNA-binding protein [Sphingobium chungangianum]